MVMVTVRVGVTHHAAYKPLVVRMSLICYVLNDR